MCLPEPSNICLMLFGRMSPKGSNTHAWFPLQKKTSKYTCQAVGQENITKDLEKQGATQKSHWWQCGVDYLLPDYLKHRQDLKTRSLLPVQDYTTTTPDCFHITLQLNGFWITHVRFAATPAAQLCLQQGVCAKKLNNTCHSLQRSIHFLTSLLVETLEKTEKKMKHKNHQNAQSQAQNTAGIRFSWKG